ncbi:MAG: flagellar motor protein MotB [Synergistales bacterium]|nr:flagellar motor protein MotB [Synergistales bacterium]
MARKRRSRDEEGGAGWLMTYGDMMTLLLVFFVFLFAFSTIDVQKFQKMIMSFQGAIGVMPGGETTQESDKVFQGETGVDAGEARKQTQEILDVARQVQTLIREEGLEDEVSVRVDQRGVTISMTDQLLFELGSATLLPPGKRILAKLAELLQRTSVPMSVEGHTDNLPFRGDDFRNNWELSASRAVAVVTYLQRAGVRPRRMEAVGFGQYRPIVPNDTREHRALNRRVDIVLLSEYALE